MPRLLLSLIVSAILITSACTEKKPEEFWIDVRTEEEYKTGHLEKAVLIPHDQIAARIAEVTENRDAEIHLYCRSGGRAGRAKTSLEALGFTKVLNEGGYEDLMQKMEKD